MHFNFVCFIHCIYDRNFALHYLERLESIRVLGTDRRSVLMIRVKVNSKSELVENREKKSALYRVPYFLAYKPSLKLRKKLPN